MIGQIYWWPLGSRGGISKPFPSTREPNKFLTAGTISRKTSDSTDKFDGQNLLDIAVTNALELLRGQNFEN
jgi:hypothetical protein